MNILGWRVRFVTFDCDYVHNAQFVMLKTSVQANGPIGVSVCLCVGVLSGPLWTKIKDLERLAEV